MEMRQGAAEIPGISRTDLISSPNHNRGRSNRSRQVGIAMPGASGPEGLQVVAAQAVASDRGDAPRVALTTERPAACECRFPLASARPEEYRPVSGYSSRLHRQRGPEDVRAHPPPKIPTVSIETLKGCTSRSMYAMPVPQSNSDLFIEARDRISLA